MTNVSLRGAAEAFLKNVKATQAKHTAKNYQADLLGSTGFVVYLLKYFNRESFPANELNEEMAAQYFQDLLLKNVSPATFQRRASAIREFFRFLEARRWAPVSADRLTILLKAGKLKPNPKPLERFDELEEKIVRTFDYAISMVPNGEEIERLIQLRDKAFVITLADTGMRVHEACKLRRGDIDWMTGKGLIIGKGNKEGTIRFSPRALHAARVYVEARGQFDGATGISLSNLPLFARHDLGGRKKVKPISTDTGEDIVHKMVHAALGSDYDERVTCHKFRHYFVTTILRKTDNLKIAQEMARHKTIQTTQRYGHVGEEELDRRHAEIFS